MTTEFESEKEASETIGNFYEQLPRFVIESPGQTAGSDNYLHSIERVFEWRGRKFAFTISPARAGSFVEGSAGSGIMHYFPGAAEESLERALRRLAVIENADFDRETYTLYCSFDDLAAELSGGTRIPGIDRKDLGLSLEIMANATYILKGNGTEFYFRPIEELRWVENKGKAHYFLRFPPVFFGIGEFFN